MPLTAVTIEETTAQLRERRANFSGMRSLMRVRATSASGRTQTFRAQLIVHDAQRMELIAYTPVGTTVLKMKADGDRISSDPPIAPDSFNFLRSFGLTPAETAMIVLGLPPREGLEVKMAIGGVAEVHVGEFMAIFETPSFPAKRVTISTMREHVEIEHLEVVSE